MAKSDLPLTEAELEEVKDNVSRAIEWFNVGSGSKSPDELQECIREVASSIRSQPGGVRNISRRVPSSWGACGGKPFATGWGGSGQR